VRAGRPSTPDGGHSAAGRTRQACGGSTT
jgi:hypothetical protein